MKGDFTLQLLTSNDKNLAYTYLVKQSAIELFHSDVSSPELSTNDVWSAIFRVAGNSCDDVMSKLLSVICSPNSRAKIETAVREAYQWKKQGLW